MRGNGCGNAQGVGNAASPWFGGTGFRRRQAHTELTAWRRGSCAPATVWKPRARGASVAKASFQVFGAGRHFWNFWSVPVDPHRIPPFWEVLHRLSPFLGWPTRSGPWPSPARRVGALAALAGSSRSSRRAVSKRPCASTAAATESWLLLCSRSGPGHRARPRRRRSRTEGRCRRSRGAANTMRGCDAWSDTGDWIGGWTSRVPARPCPWRPPRVVASFGQMLLSRDAGLEDCLCALPAFDPQTENSCGRDGFGLVNQACVVGNAGLEDVLAVDVNPCTQTRSVDKPVPMPNPSASDGSLGSFPDREIDHRARVLPRFRDILVRHVRTGPAAESQLVFPPKFLSLHVSRIHQYAGCLARGGGHRHGCDAVRTVGGNRCLDH